MSFDIESYKSSKSSQDQSGSILTLTPREQSHARLMHFGIINVNFDWPVLVLAVLTVLDGMYVEFELF